MLVCFDAGNLESVARELRAKKTDARILICADDDQFKKENTGLTKGAEAAVAVNGEPRGKDEVKIHEAGGRFQF